MSRSEKSVSKKSVSKKARPRAEGENAPKPVSRQDWARRFGIGVALWLLPVAIIWTLVTPFYNHFLTTSAENLVRLTESPRVTRLVIHDKHHLVITRTDLSGSRIGRPSIRTG